MQPGERPEGALRALPEPGARPEAMDEAEIEAQVARHLKEGLEVIPEAELAAALHNYVDKVGLSVRPAEVLILYCWLLPCGQGTT